MCHFDERSEEKSRFYGISRCARNDREWVRTHRFVLAFIFITCLFCQDTWAAVDYLRVIESRGTVEILEADGIQWKPLILSGSLRGGDKIRTVGQSYVEFSTSTDLSGLLRLGVNSQMEVMGDDLARFILRQGTLLVLREEDGNVSGAQKKEDFIFQIFTPDTLVGFLNGGCSVHVSEKGTRVYVFSESVNAGAKIVTEGFKYFVSRSGLIKTSGPSRMHFGDYKEWQTWIKKCYDRKDALTRQFLTPKTG